MTFSLSAVNLAESAGQAVEAKDLVDMYVLAAMRARATLPYIGVPLMVSAFDLLG